ncbi:hypothetical protein VTK56DRAFT_7909 [Thermocarpiscus australiensis]
MTLGTCYRSLLEPKVIRQLGDEANEIPQDNARRNYGTVSSSDTTQSFLEPAYLFTMAPRLAIIRCTARRCYAMLRDRAHARCPGPGLATHRGPAQHRPRDRRRGPSEASRALAWLNRTVWEP